MGQFNKSIKHDGGRYDVEVDIEGDQAVIYFGPSFTLRVDEGNLDNLRELLFEASRNLASNRSAQRVCWATGETETDPSQHHTMEDEFIQVGIDAREQQKLDRMMQGTASPITNDPIDW
jgi:hypothetical protein